MSLEGIIKSHSGELAIRDRGANKGSYGRLLIIAGSRGMAGAAYLSGLAALRCGAGMVKYYGPEDNRFILQTLLPEAMYGCDDEDLDSALKWGEYVIIGPGLSTDSRARAIVHRLFDDDILPLLIKKKLIVIDADALNIIAEEGLDLAGLSRGCHSVHRVSPEENSLSAHNIVITPHVMEMLRLLKTDNPSLTVADIKRSPAAVASEYCHRHNVTVVLKDSVTTVAGPDEVLSLDYGCGAMAKAGSGDVLCGFIAGTVAVLGGNVADGVPLAVYLHGRAGCIASVGAQHSLLARDIANAAPGAIRETASRG